MMVAFFFGLACDIQSYNTHDSWILFVVVKVGQHVRRLNGSVPLPLKIDYRRTGSLHHYRND